MASVVCPHCNTKIRLTRKPKENTSSQPPAPDSETPDGDEPSGFPKIKTRRTRKRINLNGLQLDDSDLTDSEIDETEEAPFEIKTRRTRKRVNLNNLQLDETDQPETIQPQPPAQPKRQPTKRAPTESKPPSTSPSPASDASSISTPISRPPRNPSPKPKPTSPSPASKTNAPSPEAVEPQKTVETPPDQSPIAPSGKHARPKPTSTKESIQPQTPDLSTAPTPHTTDSAPVAKHDVSEPESHAQDSSGPSIDSSILVSPVVASAPAFSSPIEALLDEQEDENSLLPPKFLVADIEANENAVVLPSATSGTQVASRSEVTVSHNGKTIKLVTSSPEELRRIRLIENLIALVIAGIMLAIAVWVLL